MRYRMIAFFAALAFLSTHLMAEKMTKGWLLVPTKSGLEVLIDGTLFAGYRTDVAGTPIIYPIKIAGDRDMTRHYPMKKDYDGAQTDHIHHRSLWFGHGDVNGSDFWTNADPCKIVLQHWEAKSNKNSAWIITKNNWVGKENHNENSILCSDVRTITFSIKDDVRMIDFDVTITAEQEKVTFGDTKEGTFGLRVPESMAVDSGNGGRFTNAEGKTGEKEAWGKRSAWVNYQGEISSEEKGGKVKAGIVIMNHPSSFRYPTYWHVRDYGLFAANPFGIHEFDRQNIKGQKTLPTDVLPGEFVLRKGESLTLRYRLLFYQGESMTAERIAEAFKEYADKR